MIDYNDRMHFLSIFFMYIVPCMYVHAWYKSEFTNHFMESNVCEFQNWLQREGFCLCHLSRSHQGFQVCVLNKTFFFHFQPIHNHIFRSKICKIFSTYRYVVSLLFSWWNRCIPTYWCFFLRNRENWIEKWV